MKPKRDLMKIEFALASTKRLGKVRNTNFLRNVSKLRRIDGVGGGYSKGGRFLRVKLALMLPNLTALNSITGHVNGVTNYI